MDLYHGTTIDRLEDILAHGLLPQRNWDSGDIPVISLTNSPEKALIVAFAVDATKIELGGKSKPAEYFVALKIKSENYNVQKWQVDEWWIKETIRPEDLEIILQKDYETVKKEWEIKK